jgi:hypothetical protein
MVDIMVVEGGFEIIMLQRKTRTTLLYGFGVRKKGNAEPGTLSPLRTQVVIEVSQIREDVTEYVHDVRRS